MLARSFFAIVILMFCLMTAFRASAYRGQAPAKEEVSIGSFTTANRCFVDPLSNIYVIDAGTGELSKYSKSGKLLCKIGGFGWTTSTFDQPADLCCPNGLDVYVADLGNHRIQRFDRNLSFVSSLSLRDNADPDQRFGYPRGVAMDRFGALYIVDGENIRVLKIDASNNVERVFGGEEAGKGRLRFPSRIRVSGDDLVYVQDGNSIIVFDIFGNYVRTTGDGLFRSLRAFSVDMNRLNVLDSCAVRTIDSKGRILGGYELSHYDSTGQCDFKDIATQGRQLFLLTAKNVVVCDLPESSEEN